MTDAFWQGFEKQSEDAADPVPDRTTTFAKAIGLASKHRGEDHVRYEDNYSTTGVFGY